VKEKGVCRIIHADGIHNLYSSNNIWKNNSKMTRWPMHVARLGCMRNGKRVLLGKIQGRPSHRCEDNIKEDITELEWNEDRLFY
jgi:hypothetical protein